ncbi:MAG TPA: YqeG family HAD IIIA-type phosphatase [Syntrophomonadaceae bacterium]|nr:YqeG family HAD IIIA-type phosphatase [Syntrophomonadaceae bacterium]
MINFEPDLFVDSLLDIPLDLMLQKNIKAFIFDLDNTITEWNSHELRQEVVLWFEQLLNDGFKACLLSNNKEERVLTVARLLALPYVYRAQKPRRMGFKRAVELLQINPWEAAVVGDQIFTDVWGGKRSGLYTILVKPISRREFPGTKLSRCMEFFVLHRWEKKRKRTL